MTRADSAPHARTPASTRPVPGPAASSVLMMLLAVAWVLVPPYLVFAAAITGAPFLGEAPTAAEQAQSAQLLLGAFVVAAAAPWTNWALATACGWPGAARFWAAAGVLSGSTVAVLALLAAGAGR